MGLIPDSKTMRGAANSRIQELSERNHLAKQPGDATHANQNYQTNPPGRTFGRPNLGQTTITKRTHRAKPLDDQVSAKPQLPNEPTEPNLQATKSRPNHNYQTNPPSQTSGRQVPAKPQLPNEPTGPTHRATDLGQTTITKRTHRAKPPGDESRPSQITKRTHRAT